MPIGSTLTSAPRDSGRPRRAAAASRRCGCVTLPGKSAARRRARAARARSRSLGALLVRPRVAFITASPVDRELLCGILIVPKHRLENRRLTLEYTFGPAMTVSRSASAPSPACCSSTSIAFASEYDRWLARITSGLPATASRCSVPETIGACCSTGSASTWWMRRASGSLRVVAPVGPGAGQPPAERSRSHPARLRRSRARATRGSRSGPTPACAPGTC